jgi:hypothetical protein
MKVADEVFGGKVAFTKFWMLALNYVMVVYLACRIFPNRNLSYCCKG